jgi:hypothetical protein
MKISHPGPGVLRLSKSRAAAAMTVGFTVLFFVAWYSFQISIDRNAADRFSLFRLLFWVAPLFALPEVFRQLRVLTSGETFTLSRTTGVIGCNGSPRARFSEAERVQIRTIRDADSSDEYRLSIVLKNGDKIRIDQSCSAKNIADAAEDIADMLGVEITRK